MQDVGSWYPSFEDRNKRLLHCLQCPLTAACECLVPQSIDALPEGAQLSEIARHRVVAVITDDDATEPVHRSWRGDHAYGDEASPLMALSFAAMRGHVSSL